ncbi:hypothetical protein [Nonomuraea ceibae]|uniref:hypothetical protein n=1 Tax=Nonomuraea ceibae TaxID=1935170 RepID=UPI001C5D4558|nr:hypothetical protein [Nonomuraea ceibae]
MLTVRGVSYLVDDAPPGEVGRDLRVIREELHCTAVMLIGTDEERLIRAAEQALDAGLEIWVRPHLRDRPRPEVLAHLERVATAAERLRAAHPDRVTLLVGSEFSHTAPGIVPLPWSYLRLLAILRARRLLRRRITRKLDAFLDRAARCARQVFHGPLSYAAAGWEQVDWSRFDVAGVSLYRSGDDHAGYERRLRSLVRDQARPVVVTEFGCGAFTGADLRGAASFRIVRWFAEQPEIRGDHPRDERTQAAYLGELIGLYDDAGVHGCFVFTFAMRGFPHRDDPRLDLDKAGFGIVKVADGDDPAWTPKAAFHEVAHRYRSLLRENRANRKK